MFSGEWCFVLFCVLNGVYISFTLRTHTISCQFFAQCFAQCVHEVFMVGTRKKTAATAAGADDVDRFLQQFVQLVRKQQTPEKPIKVCGLLYKHFVMIRKSR